MNVTKTIKYTKLKLRVYNLFNNEVVVISINYLSKPSLKQLKEDLSKDGFAFLQIISEEHFSKKYSMEVHKFIENAEEIKEEKGE